MNLIRILPQKDPSKLYYKKVKLHYRLKGSKMQYCRSSIGEECPVCEFIERLPKTDSRSVEVYRRLKPVRRYLMNIVPLDEEKRVVLYLAPQTVFMDISSIIFDPDYGDVTDPVKGRNLVIEKIVPGGDRGRTEYKVRAKPNVSPVDSGLLEHVVDLEGFVRDRVISYEAMEAMLRDGGDDEDVMVYYSSFAERMDSVGGVTDRSPKIDMGEDVKPALSVRSSDKVVEESDLQRKIKDLFLK
uniref:Bacteriophage T4 Gp32 single-stranded DNA-binding domain-containing protein n=1 Tax=candidate division CPR3 bacterium TaxID=2268181 RepID=A0A7V3J969_UNCC3